MSMEGMVYCSGHSGYKEQKAIKQSENDVKYYTAVSKEKSKIEKTMSLEKGIEENLKYDLANMKEILAKETPIKTDQELAQLSEPERKKEEQKADFQEKILLMRKEMSCIVTNIAKIVNEDVKLSVFDDTIEVTFLIDMGRFGNFKEVVYEDSGKSNVVTYSVYPSPVASKKKNGEPIKDIFARDTGQNTVQKISDCFDEVEEKCKEIKKAKNFSEIDKDIKEGIQKNPLNIKIIKNSSIIRKRIPSSTVLIAQGSSKMMKKRIPSSAVLMTQGSSKIAKKELSLKTIIIKKLPLKIVVKEGPEQKKEKKMSSKTVKEFLKKNFNKTNK